MTRGRATRASVAFAVGAGLCSPMLGSEPAADPGLVVRAVYLFGTRATLAVRAERGVGQRAIDGMLTSLEASEAELSTWRPDSLLSRVNLQPVDEPLEAPPRLCGLLEELAAWRHATGNAFDPAVGNLIEAWGLHGAGRRPSPDELARARRHSSLEQIAVRDDPCTVTRTVDVRLDAGAFGKGAALDRLAHDTRDRTAAPWLADLGGQVAVGSSEDAPWTVALAHPNHRTEAAVELRLDSGSLATSGGSEHDVVVDGQRLGHILDPRTGLTIERAGSVSVWHESAMVADLLSTAMYVMGPDAGLAWAEAHHAAVCFLEPREDDRIRLSASQAFLKRFPGTHATRVPGG